MFMFVSVWWLEDDHFQLNQGGKDGPVSCKGVFSSLLDCAVWGMKVKITAL